MMQTLWALAQIFTQLSVLAFGGATPSCRKCSGRSSMCTAG